MAYSTAKVSILGPMDLLMREATSMDISMGLGSMYTRRKRYIKVSGLRDFSMVEARFQIGRAKLSKKVSGIKASF